jgi:hypothetical protein
MDIEVTDKITTSNKTYILIPKTYYRLYVNYDCTIIGIGSTVYNLVLNASRIKIIGLTVERELLVRHKNNLKHFINCYIEGLLFVLDKTVFESCTITGSIYSPYVDITFKYCLLRLEGIYSDFHVQNDSNVGIEQETLTIYSQERRISKEKCYIKVYLTLWDVCENNFIKTKVNELTITKSLLAGRDPLRLNNVNANTGIESLKLNSVYIIPNLEVSDDINLSKNNVYYYQIKDIQPNTNYVLDKTIHRYKPNYYPTTKNVLSPFTCIDRDIVLPKNMPEDIMVVLYNISERELNIKSESGVTKLESKKAIIAIYALSSLRWNLLRINH